MAKFKPVRCVESQIPSQASAATEGYIYFATDSGKIYLDKSSKRYLMGGAGSSIYYAADDAVVTIEDNVFGIAKSSLEDQTNLPKIGDLIINSDGSFYRVDDVSSDQFTCSRIAVSGSGGGTGATYSDRAKIDKQDPESSYLINGSSAKIKVKATSGKDPQEGTVLDRKLTIFWSLSVQDPDTGVITEYAHDSFPINASTDEEEVWEEFEYGQIARNSATNILTMYATGSSSTQSRSFSYTFHTTKLELLGHSQFTNSSVYSPNDVVIYNTVVGDVDKYIFYYFDDVLLNTGGTLVNAAVTEPSYAVPAELCTHGNHKVRIELYQSVNGKVDTTSSAKPIEMEIAVVAADDLTPVIWIGDYQSTYYQYDNIKIPFNVYDPNNSMETEVRFYKNSTKMSTLTIPRSTSFATFEIVNADLGELNYYYIKAGENEYEVTREIAFSVIEDPARTGMKTITNGLQWSFTAQGRSNAESATNRKKGLEGENIGAFKDFNWYSNGWERDDNSNAVLRISNNAEYSYPLGETTLAGTNASNQSCTFEFQFKVRNVQDYSNIIHNITRYKGNTDDRYPTYPNWTDEIVYSIFNNKSYLEDSEGKVYDNYDAFLQWYMPIYAEAHPDDNCPPSYDDIEYWKTEKLLSTGFAAGSYYDGSRGILLGAQDALFTNGTDTVNVSYVEDKLINLTVTYAHGEGTPDGANMLMSIYLNGVLTGVARSSLIDSQGKPNIWTIGDSNTKMIFNSKYCDFDLYKIRVYNRALTIPEILTNYAVDLKDTLMYDETTQLAALNRDLNEYQLSYNSMLTYNANHLDNQMMPYIIFDTEHASDGDWLPYSKATPIHYVRMTFVNPALDRAYTTGKLNELAEAMNSEQKAAAEAQGLTNEQYYYLHHCPSWTGENVDMSVQGTSSEFYPRRNYKAKTQVKLDADGKFDDKNGTKTPQIHLNRGPFADMYANDPESTKQSFFYYDNYTVGTSKFTLKIDYMESSGTYNMGFANLVKNAYSHHPLFYYNQANAFVEDDPNATSYVEASGYEEGGQYFYRNHKGNWKDTVNDELKIASAEDYAMGPVAYAASIGQSKVLTEDKIANCEAVTTGKETVETLTAQLNKWFVKTAGYKKYEFEHLDDYRTSVQGIPTLAFHKKSDGSYTFIGKYNMLVDKGSDEAYGYKPLDKVKQKYIKDSMGAPVALENVAECWEMENNSRGFCSFRDALPADQRTDDKFFDTSTYTAKGAPLVADYYEYRYNAKGDALDVLYSINDMVGDSDSVSEVQSAFGVDISDPTIDLQTGIAKGVLDGGQALLDCYSNLEKAVRWVWETDQESVPSMGTYVPIELGLAVYAPNTYYIATTTSNVVEGETIITTSYTLDESAEFDSEKVYYVQDNSVSGGYASIKLTDNASNVYASGTFYVQADDGTYILEAANSVFDSLTQYYNLIVDEANSGAQQLAAPVQYGNITYSYDTKEYRNAKFVNELEKHFNTDYLATYFVMTEVFECYDSRGKNCMLASWGPMEEGGDYIWFPIFYDIDTQLGINNTGIPSFEYYVDATEDGCFSTNDSLLWNNFYKNFKSLIIQKYRQLKNKSSTFTALRTPPIASIDRIEKWYTTNSQECGGCLAMEGRRPLIALNLDEYYKYISITNPKIGYQNRNGGDNPISYDNGTYFYALQGDRSLSRQQFLTNRINYLDSWLNQGNYERGGANVIVGRIAANSPSNTSDKWIEGANKNSESTLIVNEPYWANNESTIKTHMFDAEYWVNMSPVRNSYVTVGTDASNFPSLKYIGEPVRFTTPDLENGVRKSGGYHEQLYYIYGIDQMKSLGDMSKLYWTEFKIEGSATKMTDLLLGYDGLDEEGNTYNNTGVNMYGIHASKSVTDNGGMPLLKKVNLSNLIFNETSPTYNFASCDKLEDFRAIGSNITGLTFAEGNNLEILYLPETLTGLGLTEAGKLTKIVTHYVQRDETNDVDVEKGLYIPGLTDATTSNARSRIETLSLINDHMGYDSYKLLELYYAARSGVTSGSKITMTNVEWCPYKLLDEGSEYVQADSALYFVDSGHYTFEPYVYDSVNWNLQLKNGEIYKLDESIDKTQIKSLDLLKNLHNSQYFKSTANDDDPIITGIIYVDNDTNLSETDIKAQVEAFYPNLKIFVNPDHVIKAYSAKFMLVYADNTYDVLATDKINDGWFTNPMTIAQRPGHSNMSSIQINKLIENKDFYGWTMANPTDNQGHPIKVNSDYVENMANSDPDWYKSNKGFLSVTTDDPNSAGVPVSEQYDNWSSQSLENNVYDYVFYATFATHKYRMTFYDGDGTTVLDTLYIDAGAHVTPTLSLPILDDSALDLEKTNKFTGTWLARSGRNLTAMIANSDYEFFPQFEEADVHESILNTMYLNISADGTVSPAPGVQLKGKITIPAKINNIDVKYVSGFGGQNVTHVFFEQGNKVQAFLQDAFRACANLKWVEVPAGLTEIGSNAFWHCTSLATCDWRAATGLESLGSAAFQGSFGTWNGTLTFRFPGSIKFLQANCLARFPTAVDVDYIIIGSADDPVELNTVNATSMAQNARLNGGGPDELIIKVYTTEAKKQDVIDKLTAISPLYSPFTVDEASVTGSDAYEITRTPTK